MWVVFIWLMTETSGGLSGNTVMKFGFYKMRRISRRAEGLDLLAFQYGFCNLEVVLQLVGKVDKNQL
jgi:hypothetical protein